MLKLQQFWWGPLFFSHEKVGHVKNEIYLVKITEIRFNPLTKYTDRHYLTKSCLYHFVVEKITI
jgi:hypothetical protein